MVLPDQTPAFGRARRAAWLAMVLAALTLTAGCGPEATRPADMSAVVQEWRGRALPAEVRDLLLAYAAESSADARRDEVAGVRVRRDTWRGMKAAAGREAVDWAALDEAMAVLRARAGHPDGLVDLAAAVAGRDARALRVEIDRRRDVGPILGARTLPLRQGEHEELPQVSCPASASGFERPSNALNRRNSTEKRPDLTLFAADRSRFASVCLQNPGFCRTPDAPVPIVAPNSPRIRAA